MSRIDPVWAGVAELSCAFGTRVLSPVDAVEALLDRIKKYNPSLHAFIAVYDAEARLAAEAADKAIRSGHRVGPLHGVPIALKDLVDLEGRVTTAGSKVWADRVSPVTATLAERLISAGMIVLGKTHTVEFAMGSFGTNTHMGTPRNPWDLNVHRTPGGSSSGSGVAVAAGLVPVAIGTDTGGSVRLPAGWCGIVGLKVTAGRISTYGVLPLSSTLDTPGPMARSVEDAALIFRALNGPDPRDRQTLAWTPVDPLPMLRRGVGGLRIGVMPDVERVGVDKEVLAAHDASVDALLTPTTLTPAIPIDQVDQSGTAAHFTRAGNYLGLCGIAIPNGFTRAGLPTSLQILCHTGDEATALRIGWAYEEATLWHERHPTEA